MGNLKPDYSRRSFVEIQAPAGQWCACGCNEYIQKGQVIFARPFLVRNRLRGHTRIVNMGHYENWFENVAHESVKTIVKRRPELKSYFED